MHGPAQPPSMASPWKRLYAMTWLVVLEFLLAIAPGESTVAGWLHAALGLGILALAYANARSLRETAVPGRTKRTARASVGLAAALAVLGVLLILDVGAGFVIAFGVTVWATMLVLHVFLALGVLAQAAAVGISYDMWEEREFLEETVPGEVPAPPVPARPVRGARGSRQRSAP